MSPYGVVGASIGLAIAHHYTIQPSKAAVNCFRQPTAEDGIPGLTILTASPMVVLTNVCDPLPMAPSAEADALSFGRMEVQR